MHIFSVGGWSFGLWVVVSGLWFVGGGEVVFSMVGL